MNVPCIYIIGLYLETTGGDCGLAGDFTCCLVAWGRSCTFQWLFCFQTASYSLSLHSYVSVSV